MEHEHLHEHEHCTHEHPHEHPHDHEHPHVHPHDHEHPHTHPHEHSHDHAPLEGDKVLALLTYMLDHNVHHCAELKELGASLTGEAAHQLAHAVEAFEQANDHLSAAIEEMKK